MNKHFELIAEYCDVREVVGDNAIFYYDFNTGYAEINGVDYRCKDSEEFHELLEMFGDVTAEDWEN